MPNAPFANSTYLDFTSHGMTTATSVDEAYGFPAPSTPSSATINVALVLPRANDPTTLLTGNWAARQRALAALNDSHTLWSTYGAVQTDYDTVVSGLEAMNIPIIGDANGASGYVTSEASRTIWVTLTPENFEVLFGTKPFQGPPDNPIYYWKGGLSLPDTWNIDGLWFDTSPIYGTFPATSDLSEGAVATLDQGPQSIGNQLLSLNKNSINYARDIADWFYNFPLSGLDIKTTIIGLVEPGIGDAIPEGSSYTFQDGLDSFRVQAGNPTFGYYYNVANGGQGYTQANNLERSLDVGVVASANRG